VVSDQVRLYALICGPNGALAGETANNFVAHSAEGWLILVDALYSSPGHLLRASRSDGGASVVALCGQFLDCLDGSRRPAPSQEFQLLRFERVGGFEELFKLLDSAPRQAPDLAGRPRRGRRPATTWWDLGWLGSVCYCAGSRPAECSEDYSTLAGIFATDMSG
jgi:hypothetical protein